MTTSLQEFLLAAWSLLLSQEQDVLNIHLTRVPLTLNQEGAMEMREEVLSSEAAQDMDACGYQVPDLDHVDHVLMGK